MADLPEITIQGRNFPNIFAQLRQTVIGGIAVKVSVEQKHSDRLTVTKNPVQAGAEIADHSYKVPADLVLRCGWSNSSLEATQAIASGLVNQAQQAIAAGSFSGVTTTMAAASYVDGKYKELLDLQGSRQVFDVITIRRKYSNMLMTSLLLTTDDKTAQAIMVEAGFEELIIVNTSAATLPPMANQQTPASTAEVQPTGVQNAAPASPSPGGSYSPSDWGSSLL